MHRSSSIARRVSGDRPLPPPPSSPKGVSFPSAEVCQVLEQLWASRDQRLPQWRDYYADQAQVPEQEIFSPRELTLGKLSIRDTSSSSMEAEAVTNATIEEVSPTPSDHSPPPISARGFHMWQRRFFIRTDRGGIFHTYPQLGGPFPSVKEAEDAIARHLDELRSPFMCPDGLSPSEIGRRYTLYWPDGTRKSSESCPGRRNISLLVHSLLDRYNEDQNLLGDVAYELEDVVSYGEIYERTMRRNVFYHINFTIKTKGAHGLHSGDDNLFFAEVTCMKEENEEYVLDCLCMVKSNDKGQCYACEDNGRVGLRHPTNAHEYKHGHSKPYPRCCGFNNLPREIVGNFRAYDDEEARLPAEESRIRNIYKCLGDPGFVAKLDGERRAALPGSYKREDGQGKEPIKYVVPVRRCQLGQLF